MEKMTKIQIFIEWPENLSVIKHFLKFIFQVQENTLNASYATIHVLLVP